MVVRELHNHPSLGFEPVGFVDDDPRKKGLYLLDVPILGDRHDIPRLVKELRVDEIIIAMPSVPGRVVRELVEIAKTTGARLKTVPGIYELINGRVSVNQIREVQVEDLLGREPVQLDLEEIASYLTGRVVLVTGAGGSIGSELCRQIARFRPACLVMLDHSENNLFEIESELLERCRGVDAPAELADVRDQAKVEQIFEKYRPQVVFHAAAHKHVPMMERCPEQAVANNVLGTYITAGTALRFQSEIFVLVSTDKAVRPRSVMGATKRAAELVIQYLNEKSRQGNLRTRFAAVRFGNVLGSRGSVIPIFKRQIARGGPVTVTHPEMVRYFMTIPEAVQLIIQAGALARGGEIFVLDMGEPVKILDLARDLIRLSGLVPDRDIEIKITGIRPGEKLKEELFTPQEERTATKNSRIFIARNGDCDPGLAATLLEHLDLGFGLKTPEEALTLLGWLFPGWHAAQGSVCPAAPALSASQPARKLSREQVPVPSCPLDAV
jgi:FlaA1/EpsC-like NDP-sugar epimerase